MKSENTSKNRSNLSPEMAFPCLIVNISKTGSGSLLRRWNCQKYGMTSPGCSDTYLLQMHHRLLIGLLQIWQCIAR